MREDLSLVHDRLNTFFCYNSGLVNNFEGIDLFGFFIVNPPNSAKASLAYDPAKTKRIFIVYILGYLHYCTLFSERLVGDEFPIILLL